MTPPPGWGLGEARLRPLFAAGFALAMLGALGLLLVSLGRAGERARRLPPGPTRVLLFPTASEAVFALERAGVRGAVLVQAGRARGLVVEQLQQHLPRGAGVYTAPFLPPLPDSVTQYRRTSGHQTWPMVARTLGVSRSLLQWVTPQVFDALLAAAGRRGGAGVPCARADDEIGGRWVCGTLPPLKERVVLVVNASWFEDQGAKALVEQLERARVGAAVIAVSLDADDPAVTDAARAAAQAFAAALEGAR